MSFTLRPLYCRGKNPPISTAHETEGGQGHARYSEYEEMSELSLSLALHTATPIMAGLFLFRFNLCSTNQLPNTQIKQARKQPTKTAG